MMYFAKDEHLEGKMRKMLFFFAMSLIFMSCLSYPENPERYAHNIIIWDESLSKEQSIGIFITTGLTVTSYNGISVNWGKNTLIYLPPGTVNLLIDANYQTTSTGISGRNWPFQWTFNAGERRYLTGWVVDGEPVIHVIDGSDKSTRWMDQAYYRVPLQRGPIILN